MVLEEVKRVDVVTGGGLRVEHLDANGRAVLEWQHHDAVAMIAASAQDIARGGCSAVIVVVLDATEPGRHVLQGRCAQTGVVFVGFQLSGSTTVPRVHGDHLASIEIRGASAN